MLHVTLASHTVYVLRFDDLPSMIEALIKWLKSINFSHLPSLQHNNMYICFKRISRFFKLNRISKYLHSFSLYFTLVSWLSFHTISYFILLSSVVYRTRNRYVYLDEISINKKYFSCWYQWKILAYE